MSHSKHTKRGYSIYIEKWDKSAKKYINTCILCGKSGYSPTIKNENTSHVIRKELSRTMTKMELDSLGRCPECARIHDKYYK